MPDKIAFELVSPERVLVSAPVDMVEIPGGEGDFGVLPGHAPLISTIRPGVIAVHSDGAVERIYVDSGFAEVDPEHCTVLAEQAVFVKDLDRADLESRIKDAEEDVADAKSDAAQLKARTALERLQELRRALG
jgi:F-type H+-transporting ATPase subunit epsilon